MKNMSFGKLLGIFAGFLLVILIGAVAIMKMSQKKGANSVVTKTYAPAETQVANQPAAPTAPVAPEQQVAQIPAQAGPAQAALPSQQNATPAASSNPREQHPAGLGAQALYVEPAQQQDVALRLASIDSKLESIQSRLAAVEGKCGSSMTAKDQRSPATPQRTAKRVPREQHSNKVAAAPRQTSSEVKALAVVGNRAWVRGTDGAEDSVTTGDTLPAVRPRVHSVDASNGVVIMSSSAD